MSEAFNVLDVVANQMFPQAFIIVILNKFDILPRALTKGNLRDTIPSYIGGDDNVAGALDASKKACRDRLSSRDYSEVQFITTNATDLSVTVKAINGIQKLLIRNLVTDY